MKIALLGLGRMGRELAGHLLAAGHDLTVWNRSSGKEGELPDRGATVASSVAEAVTGADAVVLMLFGPDSVRQVLAEVVGAAKSGALVLDSTTIGRDAAQEFDRTCTAAGLRYADAPVAGSIKPAHDGTLGVLVGCAESDWDDVRSLATLWGDPDRVTRLGEVGAGNAAKVVINSTLGTAIAGLGDALRLAAGLGLDREATLDVLASGPFGWTIGQKRQMLLDGDFSATTFSVDLMDKDLDLALAAVDGLELPSVQAASGSAKAALEEGYDGDDYAAVAGWLDRGAKS